MTLECMLWLVLEEFIKRFFFLQTEAPFQDLPPHTPMIPPALVAQLGGVGQLVSN